MNNNFCAIFIIFRNRNISLDYRCRSQSNSIGKILFIIQQDTVYYIFRRFLMIYALQVKKSINSKVS